jgi:hypothetical protein
MGAPGAGELHAGPAEGVGREAWNERTITRDPADDEGAFSGVTANGFVSSPADPMTLMITLAEAAKALIDE